MQFLKGEGEGEGEGQSRSSSSSMSSWHPRADGDGDGDGHHFNINININIDDNGNDTAEAETKAGCTDFSHVGDDSGKSCDQMLCFHGVKQGIPISRNGEQVREEMNGGFPKEWRNVSQTEVGVFSMKKRNNCEAFGDDSNNYDLGSQLKTSRELDGRNVIEKLEFVPDRFNTLKSGHIVDLFEETEMVKRDSLRSGPSSERKEIDLELADGDCPETAKEMGSEELTLSYMCDKSKSSFKANSQAALRGSFIGPELKDKGKQSALSMSNGTEPADYSGRWLERDFLHLRTSWEEQRSCRIEKGLSSRHLPRGEQAPQLELCAEEQRQKKPKTECFQLSLGLPDVSMTLASPDLNVPPALPTQTRSIQSLGHTNHTRTSSLGHTNHTRTSSDGFTTSLEYSQSHTFVHNPSCSLTQNSLENYEYSVGSHPVSQGNDQISYGNWQTPNVSEQVSHRNHESIGQAQERSKSGRDISLYQKVFLQNGNTQGQQASQGSFGGNDRDRNFVGNERIGADSHSQGSYQKAVRQQARTLDGGPGENDSNERQFSFPREIPEQSRRDAWSSPSRSVSSQETRSTQQKRIEKGMPKPEANRDILFPKNKQVTDGEQPAMRDILTADRIIREIVLEPINIMAQKLQELPDNILDDAREYLQDLIGNNEKREHFANFQKILQRRSDLTSDMLIKSHRFQLEILVTLKTGIKTFLRCNHIPISELVDVFLDFRCRNLACKSQLPVDDCECKVCSQRSGFCSSCMCLICSEFDCAFNTCSWVGCDMCLHWCHTDCGIRKSYIKPSPSLKGAPGTTEMQFHCIACDHYSEMFGFVKDVFKRFAKEWVGETLVKELDFVRRIFQESEDPRGKQLQSKAEEMLVKLQSKNYGSSENVIPNSLKRLMLLQRILFYQMKEKVHTINLLLQFEKPYIT
ncbi:protein OBERON 4 isoform X2 [Cryptomeria japonica]|uniref:protein OBERON 4 isoform X2 n=1 Tax=Cryptomeria japonica TaxID=3369 RepID=UPI0027DAAB58|nr:protein OBERON 4 isoform X2 [Cryptomeria japonica]